MRIKYFLVLSSFLLLVSWSRPLLGQPNELGQKKAFTLVGFDERGSLSFHGTVVLYDPDSNSPSCAINLVDQDKRGRVQPSSHVGSHVVKSARWISVHNENVKLSFKLHDFLADGICTIEFGIDSDIGGTWKFETAHGISDHGDCIVKRIEISELDDYRNVKDLISYWEEKIGR